MKDVKKMEEIIFGTTDEQTQLNKYTKEDYLKKSDEYAKEKQLPEGTEEQKAGFLKLVDANVKDGKISKEGLTAILTEIFKGVVEHLKK